MANITEACLLGKEFVLECGKKLVPIARSKGLDELINERNIAVTNSVVITITTILVIVSLLFGYLNQ
ncbi:hypothetical protein RHO14_00805 [Orbus wheelerorum]